MNHQDEEIEHIYLDEQDTGTKSHAGHHMVEAVENKAEYRKLYRLIAGIFVVSTLLSIIRGWDVMRWMADFMAVFFITFAAFKFYDIEGFAHAYRNYDILAQKIRPWGYIYPFIEAFLGFWYLLSEAPIRLNILTMIVTGIAAYGVRRELKRKSKFQCACLGNFIRLPLSKVSYFEDLAMFVMAFVMVILNIVLA